jgi:antitoxin VapB
MDVYTFEMVMHAKIFHNGGSQAVRLPKSCRFPDDQQTVLVHRVGRRVILEPADQWSQAFRGALGSWKEKIERPHSREIAKTEDPFT